MSKNELAQEVPPQVEEAARAIHCHKGVKYVYRDGVYDPKNGPATSIDCQKKSTRVPAKRQQTHKVQLGWGWVAFKAVGSAHANNVVEPLPEGELLSLPQPRTSWFW